MINLEQKNDFTTDTEMTPEVFNQIGNNILNLQDEVNKQHTEQGNFETGKNYNKNDIFTYDNGKYLVDEPFTASTSPDFSKVYVISRKGYDNFKIEIDMSDVNPTKSNGKIVYRGGCENFSVEDWANWFGYKPVVMEVQSDDELTVLHECNPNNYMESTEGTDLTQYIQYANQHTYHAMVKYPRRGYKIHYDFYSKVATIYLTNDPYNKNYSYYAFDSGNVSNANLYVGTYPTTLFTSSSVSYATSESGGEKPTMSGKSLVDFRTAYSNTSRYLQNYGYFENVYMQIMHIAHFGTINGNKHYSYGSTDPVCGCGDTAGLNSSISPHKAVKMFGLEMHCGFWEWVDDVKTDSNNCLFINNTDNIANSSIWEYICKLNNCDGYIGENIVWNEKTGLLAINTDSTSDKYFHTTHIYKSGKCMLKDSYNIFRVNMDQTESYNQGIALISRMVYKR